MRGVRLLDRMESVQSCKKKVERAVNTDKNTSVSPREGTKLTARSRLQLGNNNKKKDINANSVTLPVCAYVSSISAN